VLPCVSAAAEDQLLQAQNSKSGAVNIMKEIYVSTAGNDLSGDGSEKKPFATIERARDEVRKINQNMNGDIIVHIGGGTYTIDNTI
ncbi:hypothetical protein JDS79_43135, partial [Bacillus cereus]|nr:hypothetical protein [Bacillus cereus]